MPRLAADLAILDVVLLFSPARVQRDGTHLPAIRAGDLRLEVGHAVTEGEFLVEWIGWANHGRDRVRTNGVVLDMGL
jgi:hypothetical protein